MTDTSTSAINGGARAATPHVRPAEQMADAGLMAWLGNLRNLAAEAEGHATEFAAWARQAEENQPVTPAVSQGFRTVETALRGAVRAAETVVSDAQHHHRADRERAEAPRRGRHDVEQRADVERTMRDGAV